MNDEAAALKAFLSERHAACPGCGYDLFGLGSTRCPECDLELELRVNLVEPRLGVWVFALVGASAGLGFCALLLAIFGVYALRGYVGGGWRPGVVTLGVGAVVLGVAVWVLARWRGRFRRMHGAARWGAALACWGVAIATATVFMLVN